MGDGIADGFSDKLRLGLHVMLDKGDAVNCALGIWDDGVDGADHGSAEFLPKGARLIEAAGTADGAGKGGMLVRDTGSAVCTSSGGLVGRYDGAEVGGYTGADEFDEGNVSDTARLR